MSKVLNLLSTKKFWIEFLIMTFGMALGAVAVHFFLVPSRLIVGSITGLSIVINKIFPVIPLSYYIFAINAFLLVLGFILIGKEFGAKTVYTALVLAPWLRVCEILFPYSTLKGELFTPVPGSAQYDAAGNMIEGSQIWSFMGDPWFDLLCFVLVLSFVQAVLFKINASTGGLDIIAKIINKFLGIDIGTSVSIGGGLICCTAFLINPPRLVLIGLIGTWINGLVINYFTNGFNSRKRVRIVSSQHEDVRKYILDEIKRGVTLYHVTGGYSGEKMILIEAVLTGNEFGQLLEFMDKKEIHAFTTVDNVSRVHGLWAGKKQKQLTPENAFKAEGTVKLEP